MAITKAALIIPAWIETYLQRYPGDDVVDILSFDTYQDGNPDIDSNWRVKTSQLLAVIEKVAVEKNKIAALAEFG